MRLLNPGNRGGAFPDLSLRLARGRFSGAPPMNALAGNRRGKGRMHSLGRQGSPFREPGPSLPSCWPWRVALLSKGSALPAVTVPAEALSVSPPPEGPPSLVGVAARFRAGGEGTSEAVHPLGCRVQNGGGSGGSRFRAAHLCGLERPWVIGSWIPGGIRTPLARPRGGWRPRTGAPLGGRKAVAPPEGVCGSPGWRFRVDGTRP